MLCVNFVGSIAVLLIKINTKDDGNKELVVASCDIIGAGGYGAMFDISIDPFDDNIFAARCDMGGLYMSYNKGKSWERRNILGVMSDIDFDEENEGVIWTTGSGLYKSTDHGRTFDLVFPSKESITAHGSGGENMGECLYTTNADYEPSSSLSTMAINRKSQGKNIFVAQKVDWPSDGSPKNIRVFETENGKDFHIFITLPYTSCIKLEYDEARDCLVVVTESSIAEYDQTGNMVWSKDFNLSTMVNGIIAFDSYYDKKSQKNTFAFCELADKEKNVEKDACYFTDNLQQDKTNYQDLIPLLYQKKLRDIKDYVKEGQEDYAANEYYYWLPETQFFDWRITNVHIARENVFYFYHTCTDRLVVDGKETGGEVYINAYLQYKDGNFKWIYGNGVEHAGIQDLTNESWVDWASFGPAFGFASSRQNEDMVAFSTMGTVYYTEDCKTVSQCHCTVGDYLEMTVNDGNGNEEKVSKLEWGIPIHESTTSGIDVQTTYKTVTDPFDKNHLLMACTDIGVIQSFNCGETWIHSLLSWNNGKVEPMSSYYRNTCYDIEFDKERPGVVYAIWSGTHDAPYFPTDGFLRATGAFAISYDGGTSWTMRSIRANDNVLPYRMDVDYDGDNRTIYIATEGHGFFVTHDLGQTFIEMNAGIKISTYFGKDKPAIFGNEILSCKSGIYALTAPSAWAMIPNPEDPDNPNNKIYERALYKWNQSLNKFEEIALPKEIPCVRDIEYSEKEDCLYVGAVGTTKWDTNVKTGGGVYRYKNGVFTQIFDETKFVWGLGLDSKGTLYAVSFRGEIYRFTENNTKAELLIGKEDYVGELYHILKDITFGENDNVFYVSTFGGGMYRITLKEVKDS